MGSLALSMAVCLTATSFNPVEYLAADRVDLIELNHYYDDKGALVFDQIIFYDWSSSLGRYTVRDWRLLKKPAQVPHRVTPGGDYVTIWHDAKDGDVLRRVQAPAFRETWTQYDPELANRALLPKEHRAELSWTTKKSRLARTISMPNARRR